MIYFLLDKVAKMTPREKVAPKARVTVLICTLNEEATISSVLSKVPRWVHEVLLIDGHSTDATVDIARQLRPDVRVVYQPGKGKGDALKYGVQQATGDIIVTLDADGQTDPEEIPNFIEPLLSGYDWVKGSRLTHGRPLNMPWHRWFGNKILAITSNILYGTKYTDICSGYNAFWKKVFQHLNLNYDGFAMEQQMLVKVKKAGMKVAEVAHYDVGRIDGVSKISSIKQGFIDWFAIIRELFRS